MLAFLKACTSNTRNDHNPLFSISFTQATLSRNMAFSVVRQSLRSAAELRVSGRFQGCVCNIFIKSLDRV
jgi:hypothetical protein